jgi:hypothetical protein
LAAIFSLQPGSQVSEAFHTTDPIAHGLSQISVGVDQAAVATPAINASLELPQREE